MAVGVAEQWKGSDCITLHASADLSASVNRAVRILEGSDLFEVEACNSEWAIGVLVSADADAAQRPAKVMTGFGKVVKMELGATVSVVNDLLMCDSVGRAIAHTGAVGSIGRALGTGAVGEMIPVLWMPERPVNGV